MTKQQIEARMLKIGTISKITLSIHLTLSLALIVFGVIGKTGAVFCITGVLALNQLIAWKYLKEVKALRAQSLLIRAK